MLFCVLNVPCPEQLMHRDWRDALLSIYEDNMDPNLRLHWKRHCHRIFVAVLQIIVSSFTEQLGQNRQNRPVGREGLGQLSGT